MKVAKLSKGVGEVVIGKVRGKASELNRLPEDYEVRKEQMKFIEEASKAIKSNKVFLGSAPCGIGKSLGSLLAVLPQLGENKLFICFRTRSQLHIYLKELRALKRNLSAVSFFSKQDMCPLRIKGDIHYFDFLEECRRLKENCESSTKPYCRFYWNINRKKKETEELALQCARKILAPEETVRRMSKQGFCAYEALKRVLDRVDIFLGTYHYVFNPPVREALLKSFGVSLSNVYLIVDEAHNLPAFSRELLSDRLTQNTLEGALRETETFEHEVLPSVQEYLGVLNDEIFQRAQEALEEEELKQLDPQKVSDLFIDQSGVSGSEAAETLHEYGEHVSETRRELGYERIFSYSHRVGEFMENFFEKVATKYIHLIHRDWGDRIVLEVRSFDGREITNSVLQQTRGSILMSGFLSPPKVYRDLTLYDQSDVHLQEFDSPFPSENRLILAAEDVSSRFEKRTDKMLEKWKNYIEAISEANEGNMAVFFTSYGLMRTILPLIKNNRKKIVEQRKTKRDAVIEQLSRSDDNALFGVMGGKFSEGIDYPGNLLRCVVAVGLPYATWNVYQEALISYFNHQFPGKGRTYAYLTPAILRLIQTCGRVHRSATDKGCIVILDERVTRPSVKQQLPSYYQKEMKIALNPIDCAKKIRKFWEK
ncbi:MAG: ATP-dependent DNA helicase [Candidatus Bathyarchaeota archaeon]|nr:ATP-dependent DNA helicase [Candidatus Bathyarchaeota archaeon]MDH5636000.1 ATP-dependent DNA helicase [Candidatus Bathyarchaeota archaeon]